MPDPHAIRLEDEIASIENRSRTRLLFVVLGGLLVILLGAVIVFGGRERARLRAEAARPKTEPVSFGQYLGTVGTQAVFANGDELAYVQLTGEATVTTDTRFGRPLTYDEAGQPVGLQDGITHWSLASADSVMFVIEPVANPLTGVNLDDYRQLPLASGLDPARQGAQIRSRIGFVHDEPHFYRQLTLASLTPDDYGSGGPRDWQSLQDQGSNVAISGRAQRVEGAFYLTADTKRVRLQGIEGLSAVDSLEMAWATQNNKQLSAFGRISSTPRGADTALFVMTVTAVHPVGATTPSE